MTNKLEKFTLDCFTDERGTLCVLDLLKSVDWQARRLYFVTDLKKKRGGHAVRGECKYYVCQRGSLRARFHDGTDWHDFFLNGPSEAVLMEGFFFREFVDFSADAILLAISSVDYNPADYVYSLEDFIVESRGMIKN